jgi:hypothetical protein
MEIVFLNCRLNDATLCPTIRKPFDVLPERLLVSSSRGDRTAIELFLAGLGDCRKRRFDKIDSFAGRSSAGHLTRRSAKFEACNNKFEACNKRSLDPFNLARPSRQFPIVWELPIVGAMTNHCCRARQWAGAAGELLEISGLSVGRPSPIINHRLNKTHRRIQLSLQQRFLPEWFAVAAIATTYTWDVIRELAVAVYASSKK